MAVQPREVFRRVVESDLQAVAAQRRHVIGEDVFSVGRVRNGEIGRLGIPETEPAMVFRRQHDVLHAADLGDASDLLWIPLLGQKSLGQFVHKPVVVLVRSANHTVADHTAQLTVETPMDEHPKAGILQPFELLRLVSQALGCDQGHVLLHVRCRARLCSRGQHMNEEIQSSE